MLNTKNENYAGIQTLLLSLYGFAGGKYASLLLVEADEEES